MNTHRLFFCLSCVAAFLGIQGAGGQSRAATPLTVTVGSLTANPAAVQPGQTVNFTVKMTASQTVSNYPVEFSMRPTGAANSDNAVAFTNFVAGQVVTQTQSWVVPVGDAPGSYSVTASVFSPNWAVAYVYATSSFAVGSTTTTPPPPPPPPPPASAVAAPGPNAASFSAPFYRCTRNFYVSTTGKDSNAGTQASPWLTIQNADSASRQPGDCVNVVAGTYTANVLIQHGGNAPTATGYVVYRCTTLDKCHVLAPGGGHLWGISGSGSFSVIDGFELDGNNALATDGIADACVGSDGATYGTGNSAHHIWVTNNIIHHCNLAGVDLNNKEWYYVLNNTVYHNAYTSGYQGSGIGLVVVQCIEAGNANCASGSSYAGGTGTYTPSGMDLTYAQPFHIVVSGNVVYSNMIAANNPVGCNNHTDGNGIIMDTFLDEATATITFPFQSLVSGNVAYANGGRGIHVFRASNVTVANNTAYGNGTDSCLSSYYLGDLSQAGGSNDVWINNVAQSVQTKANPTCSGAVPGGVNGTTSFCGNRNSPLVGGSSGFAADSGNSYSNNVLYGASGVQMFDNDAAALSCTGNKCNANPQYVSPLTSNFALQAVSPAIGYAVTKSYLPPVADAGACAKALTACP